MDPKLAQRLERQRSKIDTGESDTQVWDGSGLPNDGTSVQPTSELAKHLDKQTAKLGPCGGGSLVKNDASPTTDQSLRRQPTAELAERLDRQSAKLVTGESAVRHLGSAAKAPAPDRVQSELALRLEKQRSKIVATDNSAQSGKEQAAVDAEAKQAAGPEVAKQVLLEEQAAPVEAKQTALPEVAKQVQETPSTTMHELARPQPQEVGANGGAAAFNFIAKKEIPIIEAENNKLKILLAILVVCFALLVGFLLSR